MSHNIETYLKCSVEANPCKSLNAEHATNETVLQRVGQNRSLGNRNTSITYDVTQVSKDTLGPTLGWDRFFHRAHWLKPSMLNTDRINKNRLSPYDAHSLNYYFFTRFLATKVSVCPSNTWIVTKRKKNLSRFCIPYEISFSLVIWEKEWLVGAERPFYLKFWVYRPPLERNRPFLTDIRS